MALSPCSLNRGCKPSLEQLSNGGVIWFGVIQLSVGTTTFTRPGTSLASVPPLVKWKEQKGGQNCDQRPGLVRLSWVGILAVAPHRCGLRYLVSSLEASSFSSEQQGPQRWLHGGSEGVTGRVVSLAATLSKLPHLCLSFFKEKLRKTILHGVPMRPAWQDRWQNSDYLINDWLLF